MKIYREHNVGYSCRGFALFITEFPMHRWALGEVGYNLIGRLRCSELSHRALNAIIDWQHKYTFTVAEIPLTTEQALILCPSYEDEIEPEGWITVNGADEHGDIYEDAALTVARCRECGQMLPANGRWWQKIIDEHKPFCAAS